MQPIDTLLLAAHVVPVSSPGALRDHAVAIDAGRIVAVLPRADAIARFDARETVDLARHALIPGLVNLHCHAAMTLLRGIADDQPLMTWLTQHIWPAEAKHVDDAFVEEGSLVAMAEMLRAGVTCVNDMYFFPEATARAALRAGMRAAVGLIVIEFPSAYATTPQQYLEKGLAMRAAFVGEPLLSFCMAPHAPYTVADETFRRLVALADQHDMPIHTHLHETRHEVEDGLKQHGVRPFERMRHLGVVGPRLIAVHAVHLEEVEMDTLARVGAAMAHCPSSNLKLASGFAAVAALRARGVPVGFGTDGAASNNRLDVLTEMRTGALLAKAVANDASVIGAHEALEMATLQGARALGLADRIGSIEAGKFADLAAIDLGGLETRPGYDPISDLVYAAGREHVTDVWVAGTARVRKGELTTLDANALAATADAWQRKIA